MKLLLLIPIFLNAFNGFASRQGTISGRLVDREKNPVPFAAVVLKKTSDSTLVKGEISDEKGVFVFTNIVPGNYFLQIQSVGFSRKNTHSFDLAEASAPYDLGIIILEASETTLQAVNVTADKPFIERLTDRTVVNIENSAIHEGSNAIDIMEKLPGVQVNQDGAIALRGKQGVMIFLDGKPTGLSGQQLSSFLTAINSNIIQRIEIITNPSAKYDAAGNAGIINIITRRNHQEGTSGSYNIGYGQGRYGKFNTSGTLGLKKKNYNVILSYSFARRKGFNNLLLERNFYDSGKLDAFFSTNNYIIFPFTNNNPRITADLTLSPKTSLSLLASGTAHCFDPAGDNHTDIFNGEYVKTGSYDFINRSTDRFHNYSINSQVNHRLDTTEKELTFDVDYASYWKNTDNHFTTLSRDANGVLLSEAVLLGDQDGRLTIHSMKSDYSQSLAGTKIETGVKSSYVTSDNHLRFYNKTIEITSLDSTQSNHFIYKEFINAGYINLQKELSSTSIQAGLRIENTNSTGEQLYSRQSFRRKYLQLFPTLFVDHKITKDHSTNVNIGRRIDRPAYQQLNPFRKMIDATTYAEGNPFLLPQITYNGELTYAFKNMFFISAGYSITRNNIMDILVQNKEKRVTIQGIYNVDRFNYASINITFTRKLLPWWNTNTSLLSYYGEFSGKINDVQIDQRSPAFDVNSSNSFTLEKGLSIEASCKYSHRNIYGVTLMRETVNLSLGIQKQLFERKGTLTLNFSDILWKAYPRGVTSFGEVIEDWESRRDTRVATISFTYRFGKAQQKFRRTTGADDEKRRTGTN